MKKYLYSFLIIWLFVIHFLAYENPRVQTVVNYFRSKNQVLKPVLNVKNDYEIILKFLAAYYPFDENSNTKQIFKSVENLVESESRQKLLEGYKENLDFLMSKKAKRSYDLEKIIRRKKDGKYVVYLNMKKSLDDSKNFPYVFKVVFDIKNNSLANSSSAKIHNFKELIVTEPSEELIDKTLMVDSDIVTNSDFPCETNILSPITNKNEIEYKVLPSGKRVSFSPTQDFKGEVVFKAVCGRRTFEFKLANNEMYSTLYQKFENTDGQYKLKPLTEKEQLAKDIKEEFGGSLIE